MLLVRKQTSRLGIGRALPARLHLAVALITTVLLPWLIVRTLSDSATLEISQQYSLAGTAVALLLGAALLRSFMTFPGVQAKLYVASSFFSSYGLVLAIFFMARLDYSRSQFGLSFVAALLWYFAAVVINGRSGRRLRFAILPRGQAPSLASIEGVDWQEIDPDRGQGRMAFDGVVADLRADMPDSWERFLADCVLSDVPVYHFRHVEESLTGGVQIEHLSENNLGSLIPGRAYLHAKQAIDVAAAAVIGVVLLPIVALVAIAIRIESPGPAFFRQTRIGYRGAPFTVIKFRTMRHVSHPAGKADGIEEAITRDNDVRITRLGGYLRKFRIDELPQIYNILRGEMSWIGPRPEAMALSQWYESELPFYRYRHIVRPGISGWAQVNQGHVHAVKEVLSKLHFDFYYIKYFSPSLDLLIVLRTIRTMLTGFGSK